MDVRELINSTYKGEVIDTNSAQPLTRLRIEMICGCNEYNECNDCDECG